MAARNFSTAGISFSFTCVAAAMFMAVGKGVVGGLRHVDVVVGMNGLFAAHDAAGDFDGAIGDDFVGVHVGLRAAAGLPDAQGEMGVEFAGDDFVGGLDDELGFFGGEFAEILIHHRGGFFQDAEGADEFGRHGVAPDIEVDERARRLRAVVAVIGHFDRAHGIGFGARGDRGFRGSVGHEIASD